MLIFGVSPFVPFIPSCENGFCGPFELSDALDILILGLAGSASFVTAAAGTFESGEGCGFAASLLLPSPLASCCGGA